MAARFASVSEDELFEKCIIKQLLNVLIKTIIEFGSRVCVIFETFSLNIFGWKLADQIG